MSPDIHILGGPLFSLTLTSSTRHSLNSFKGYVTWYILGGPPFSLTLTTRPPAPTDNSTSCSFPSLNINGWIKSRFLLCHPQADFFGLALSFLTLKVVYVCIHTHCPEMDKEKWSYIHNSKKRDACKDSSLNDPVKQGNPRIPGPTTDARCE